MHNDRMLAYHTNGQLCIFAGIQPTELHRRKAVLCLACRAEEPEHLRYERLLSPLHEQLRQLKSRHPFVPASLELLNNPAKSGTSVAQWEEFKWSMEWEKMPLDSIHL